MNMVSAVPSPTVAPQRKQHHAPMVLAVVALGVSFPLVVPIVMLFLIVSLISDLSGVPLSFAVWIVVLGVFAYSAFAITLINRTQSRRAAWILATTSTLLILAAAIPVLVLFGYMAIDQLAEEVP
ncbi:hypothetical protein LWF01_17525 [Saxibacter everestensis]|uniref:Uncharacterized protein n=1 Tax=Saxibacter everestensis TaxID=2909229 RepID=A0ABY8QS97_9MICO|nr:hypothetical protein LWF01_17525 [Brevibacteriaceae bacterium ZFBP1038]